MRRKPHFQPCGARGDRSRDGRESLPDSPLNLLPRWKGATPSTHKLGLPAGSVARFREVDSDENQVDKACKTDYACVRDVIVPLRAKSAMGKPPGEERRIAEQIAARRPTTPC